MARKLKKIFVPDEQGNLVEYEVGGVDASTASAGQVLMADGNGGTAWGDAESAKIQMVINDASYDLSLSGESSGTDLAEAIAEVNGI